MTLIEHPDLFKTGYRLLLKTLRSKEGGQNRHDRHSKKYVSNGIEEYNEMRQKLMDQLLPEERIYSSVNERDFNKAVRLFKQRQLDADYQDKESFESFYVDIYNRWCSSLMNKSCRKDSLFLVDGDYADGATEEKFKKELDGKTEIVHAYKTKNGFHFVVKAFNYTTVSFKEKIGLNEMLLVVF